MKRFQSANVYRHQNELTLPNEAISSEPLDSESSPKLASSETSIYKNEEGADDSNKLNPDAQNDRVIQYESHLESYLQEKVQNDPEFVLEDWRDIAMQQDIH